MFPVICKIGPFSVYSYGLMLAVAVVLSSTLLAREAPRLNISKETVYDLIFWVMLGGLLGARGFYIILNLSYYLKAPLEIVMVQKGGLAWQGGLVVGFIAGSIFVKKKKMPFWPFADMAVPYLALGQAVGRIGCFLNGCCYGKPVCWGVYHPLYHTRLHPTQIYLSLGYLVIFFLLKYYRSRTTVPGQVVFGYLALAALLRFVVEFYRGDHEVTVAGLSVFQYVSLGLMVIAIYGYTYLKSRSGK